MKSLNWLIPKVRYDLDSVISALMSKKDFNIHFQSVSYQVGLFWIWDWEGIYAYSTWNASNEKKKNHIHLDTVSSRHSIMIKPMQNKN